MPQLVHVCAAKEVVEFRFRVGALIAIPYNVMLLAS